MHLHKIWIEQCEAAKGIENELARNRPSLTSSAKSS